MKKKYQGSSRVKRAQLQALRRDFENLQMKDGESVNNYFVRTMGLANNMRFHGEKMDDVTIVEKILRSLTAKFDYIVCSIEESKDIDTLLIDELQSSLLVHEQKINRNFIAEEQALKASTTNNFLILRGRGRGGSRGRGRADRGYRSGNRNTDDAYLQSKGRGRGQQFDKSKIECFRCHRFGHYRSECYTKLPNDKDKGEKLNFAENKEAETLLMTIQDSQASHKSDIWFVDTGCSNHMCGSKFFSYLNEDFSLYC